MVILMSGLIEKSKSKRNLILIIIYNIYNIVETTMLFAKRAMVTIALIITTQNKLINKLTNKLIREINTYRTFAFLFKQRQTTLTCPLVPF